MNIKRIRYAVAHLLFVMICAGGLSMSACTTVPKQDGYSNMFVVTDKETDQPIPMAFLTRLSRAMGRFIVALPMNKVKPFE